jgi:hypothetical protein
MRAGLYSGRQNRAKNMPCLVVKARQIPAAGLVVLSGGGDFVGSVNFRAASLTAYSENKNSPRIGLP